MLGYNTSTICTLSSWGPGEGFCQLFRKVKLISMVDVVLGFICAPWQGSNLLHLAMVRAMLPWVFTTDKQNCSTYLSTYYTQMTGLDMYHLEMHEHLKMEDFLSKLNNQTHLAEFLWTRLLRKLQTKTHRKGFSLNACVVSRYYLTFEYKKVCPWNLRHMVQVQTSGIVQGAIEPPRMLRNL